MSTGHELASTTVEALALYFSMAAGAAAKKLGAVAVERLTGIHGKIKARLGSPSGKEALAELAKHPTDPAAQVALRQELTKQLTHDPSFDAELAHLLDALNTARSSANMQTSSQTGEGHINVQISGGWNRVGNIGKVS
jgi:hypothetical protein